MAPFVFDRMTRGIHAFRSNVDVYHAYFQANQYNVDGVSGVFADGAQDATIFYSGRINIDAQFNPVQFFNLQTAVNVRDYTQLITNNTTIRSNRTTANAPSGQIGILYSTRFLGRFHAIANQITNVNTGISGSLGRQGTIAIVDLQIIGNNIRRNIPNGPTGLIFNRGIFIERHPSANTGFAGIFDISNNTIFDVRHGISMFNTTAGNIQINNNNVTMNEVPGTPLNGVTPRYWGIRLDNVNSNLNNTNPRIQENIITGFNATNIQIRAIMLRNSNTFLIRCNNLLNSGAGFYFSGNCPMRLRQNTMRLHHFGLWLDNNATINQQGDVNLPTDNVWSNGPNNSTPWDVYGGIAPIGNGTTRIKTYVSNGTNAILSPMFVRTLATHNPNDSWASAGFGNFEYSIAQSSIFLTGGNIPSPCNVVLIDEPEGEEISYETHLMLMEQNTTMLDTIIMEAPDEIIRELVTYEYLDIQPEVKDSSEVLQEFYDIRNVQNIGILREMDKKIEEQDYQAAESLRDMVQANNLVELAYKAVLDLTLRYETGQFNAQDSLELVDWAQSCSEIYGKATFMAQALYNLVYRTSHMFQEDCPIIIPKNILLNQNPSHELSIVLYPNPNSSVLYAECNDSEIRNAQCVIRDLNGQILYEGSFHFTKGIDLRNLSLSSGVYTIELVIEEKSISIFDKFVFIKE